MSIVSIVLAVLLAASVSGNVVLALFGIQISQQQISYNQNYNVNENANLNLVNGYTKTGDRVVFQAVKIDSLEYLTNYLQTLDSFQALNAEIVPLEKGAFLVWVPVIVGRVTTNIFRMDSTVSNSIKYGLLQR